MSAGAVIMMTIAMLVVWGGMVGAILRLRQHPDAPDDDAPGEPG